VTPSEWEISMCNVQMIRREPGLVAVPFEKAIYCHSCEQITNSTWSRCGLCGSDQILKLVHLLGNPCDPEPTPPAAIASGVLMVA